MDSGHRAQLGQEGEEKGIVRGEPLPQGHKRQRLLCLLSVHLLSTCLLSVYLLLLISRRMAIDITKPTRHISPHKPRITP